MQYQRDFRQNTQQRSYQGTIITRSEELPERIQLLDKGLNLACCQHDQAMPMLQIINYIPSVQRWQTQLKSISKKVAEQENHLNSLIGKISRNETHNSRISQAQDSYNTVNLMKQEIQTFLSRLKEMQERIAKVNYEEDAIDETPEIKDKIERNFRQHIEYSQIYLAAFKNEVQMQQVKRQNIQRSKVNLQQSKDSYGGLNLLTLPLNFPNIDRVFQSQANSYEQIQEILRQIQMIRADLPLPQETIIQFHQFNFDRIKKQILQYEQIIDGLLYQNSIKESQKNQFIIGRSKLEVLQLIRQKSDCLKWQVQGLKKKYLNDLSDLYFQKYDEDCQFIKILEADLTKDLAYLEETVEKFQKKLQQINQQIN